MCVTDILEFLGAGASFDEILTDYPFLDREDILAAIEYGAHQNRSRRSSGFVKFLIDNQLPMALARYLRRKGFDCEHVLENGLAEASDAQLWSYATANGRMIITKVNSQLVWVRLGNCRTRALLQAFEQVWQKVESSLKAGEGMIEIR